MPDYALYTPQELDEEASRVALGAYQLFYPRSEDPLTVEVPGPATVVRPPQYGIPLALRQSWLTASVPSGSPSEVGLFSSMPDRAGIGGTECSGSGYARVSHSAWRNSPISGYIARRANTGPIEFATLTGDLTAIGWGIWNGSGTLVAFGLLRNADGLPQIFSLAAGDQPRFSDGELQWGIQ